MKSPLKSSQIHEEKKICDGKKPQESRVDNIQYEHYVIRDRTHCDHEHY